MKFGKNIGEQQQGNDDLHYVDYKLLKKKIKLVVERLEADELPDALTANTAFEEELAVEIRQVNACFETCQKELLERIARLSEELTQNGACCIVLPPATGDVTDVASGLEDRCEPCIPQQQYAPFYRLVEMLQDMDRLRKYAVWNAVAVVKILKKRRKQTRFGLEDSSVERAGWLSRQNFFNGSEFAELHVALESLGRALVFSEFSTGTGDTPIRLQQIEKKSVQQCPICLDTIVDAVELSCKHHFCWKCFVMGPIAFQPGEYRMTHCPVCRRDATLAAENIGEVVLPTSALAPKSENTLSQFLHTYFAAEPSIGAQVDQIEGSEEHETETMDVVGALVKVVLADTTWQRSCQATKSGDFSTTASANASSLEQTLSGAPTSSQQAHPISNDFFNTLPPKEVQQDDRTQMYTAQKLQWLQLASSGDPFATEVDMYCPICAEPLLMEKVITTPCKHQFHEICLRRLELPVCPLCPSDLPFSWFLPSHHPLVERGFKVVPACEYRPRFPGGPSRGCSGYPLYQPPPIALLGPGGKSMRSYLHRIPPTGLVDDSQDSPRSEEQTPSFESCSKSQSSASDSSSEESDGNESADEDDVMFSTELAEPRNSKRIVWGHTALGKMRVFDTSALEAVSSQMQIVSTTQREPSGTSSCLEKNADLERTVLLIGDHL